MTRLHPFIIIAFSSWIVFYCHQVCPVILCEWNIKWRTHHSHETWRQSKSDCGFPLTIAPSVRKTAINLTSIYNTKGFIRETRVLTWFKTFTISSLIFLSWSLNFHVDLLFLTRDFYRRRANVFNKTIFLRNLMEFVSV